MVSRCMVIVDWLSTKMGKIKSTIIKSEDIFVPEWSDTSFESNSIWAGASEESERGAELIWESDGLYRRTSRWGIDIREAGRWILCQQILYCAYL